MRCTRAPSAKRINLRYIDDARVGVSFDELTSLDDVADVAEVLFGEKRPTIDELAATT